MAYHATNVIDPIINVSIVIGNNTIYVRIKTKLPIIDQQNIIYSHVDNHASCRYLVQLFGRYSYLVYVSMVVIKQLSAKKGVNCR